MLSSRNEYYQIICYFQKLISKTDMITLHIFNRFSKVSETFQEIRLILVFPSRSFFLFLFWCVYVCVWFSIGSKFDKAIFISLLSQASSSIKRNFPPKELNIQDMQPTERLRDRLLLDV
jgi:uncharacterized membrane protein